MEGHSEDRVMARMVISNGETQIASISPSATVGKVAEFVQRFNQKVKDLGQDGEYMVQFGRDDYHIDGLPARDDLVCDVAEKYNRLVFLPNPLRVNFLICKFRHERPVR